jgi:hypothetical protein
MTASSVRPFLLLQSPLNMTTQKIQSFTVINQDTITSTSEFTVNSNKYQIGRVGDVFRTKKNGHLNAPGSSPTGWFAGYSVGAQKKVDGLQRKADQ